MDNKFLNIKSDHPYFVVEEIIRRYGTQIKFEFGKYIYQENTIEDYREYIFITAKETNKERIENMIRSLSPDFELALHSRVHLESEFLHIPMIDFYGSLSSHDWLLIKQIIPDNIMKEIKIFESGSSYHAYSTILISHEEWIKFMGTILLLNTPDKKPIIDTRWVGHRLRGGFSSLRWSCNTLKYEKIPNLIDIKVKNGEEWGRP